MDRQEIITEVSKASGVNAADVERTLEGLVSVLTDAVGGPKKGGIEVAMKLVGIYNAFIKK